MGGFQTRGLWVVVPVHEEILRPTTNQGNANEAWRSAFLPCADWMGIAAGGDPAGPGVGLKMKYSHELHDDLWVHNGIVYDCRPMR